MIVLMGVAGAGKSVQSRMLADEYGYAWISTGEILRVLVTGKRRQEMLAGKLLSDEEMIQVMGKVLELIDPSQEFVLDGFPRTVFQADWLLDQVSHGRFSLTAVVHLSASEEIVRERLHKRGRQDDNDAAIEKRFGEYRNVTLPILDHFHKEKVHVYEIDGTKDRRSVHEAIMKIIHDKPL